MKLISFFIKMFPGHQSFGHHHHHKHHKRCEPRNFESFGPQPKCHPFYPQPACYEDYYQHWCNYYYHWCKQIYQQYYQKIHQFQPTPYPRWVPHYPPYYPENFVEGPCTLNKTGKQYQTQPFYFCETCNLLPPNGCCEACAKICHAGHDLVYAGDLPSFCDCGDGTIPGCPQCKAVKIPPETDPYPPRVKGPCTFNETGTSFTDQPFYQCRTCHHPKGSGCCEACAKICHAGHDLVYLGVKSAYCDCGEGKTPLFRCCNALSIPPDYDPYPPLVDGPCTYNQTGSDKYIRQPFFRCLTCGLVNGKGCCAACAKICHAGHELKYVGVVPSFCDCGEGKQEGCACCKAVKVPPSYKLLINH